MNEEKNIETCLAESILAEVASVPQDPQFRSLVNESFDPLQQQALQQAGYDAYIKVAGTHQPYTFTSSVRQMKSNLILLLRRLWRFPFGRGTIRSFADMWQHYITRLSGNPEYGIPSRLSSLTDLPSAPTLLSDRKISEPNAIEGISLARIMCSAYHPTIIEDNTTGWTMTKVLPWSDLTSIKLGCKSSTVTIISGINAAVVVLDELESFENNGGIVLIGNNSEIQEIILPKLKTIKTQWQNVIGGLAKCKKVLLPSLTDFNYSSPGFYAGQFLVNCPMLEEVYMPNFDYITNFEGSSFITNLPELKYVHLGHPTLSYRNFGNGILYNCPKLIKVEFANGMDKGVNLIGWSPTNALDASRTDLIEQGSTAQNNLQQFLSNFKTYIAERLTDQGSGKTLTLSQAVYDTIKDESHLFVFDEGTMTIYAYLTNIKHWTVTK